MFNLCTCKRSDRQLLVGIIEAPFLGKIALNVGDRQKGYHATNVRHCTNNSEEIVLNLNKILKGRS